MDGANEEHTRTVQTEGDVVGPWIKTPSIYYGPDINYIRTGLGCGLDAVPVAYD